jgi:hypothetical protein
MTDQKLTQKPVSTTLATTDIIPVVINPATLPDTRQITLANLLAQAGGTTQTSHNNSTKLATTAYVENQDGWQIPSAGYNYWSAGVISILASGVDLTASFPVGTKIKLAQTTVKYFYVTAVTYSAPWTLVTLNGGSDYTLANTAITNPFLSYASTPQGFPQWFNWTPTFGGYSGSVTGTKLFSINGNTCFLILDILGTSNATTLTMSLPVTPAVGGTIISRTLDNSAVSANPGFIQITNGNATATIFPLLSGGTWTGSNNKGCLTDGFYKI